MEKKTESRKRTLAWFAVRVVCFALVTVSILIYGVYVLTPKYDYGICPMLNVYNQPEDGFDVLVVGSSLAYSGCNTNVLWRKYGIACYNLCGAELPYWSTYYELKELLQYHTPKLILLDAKAATYTADYSKPARTILSTYGILNLENRIGAIFSCQETSQRATGFVLAYPEIHTNYVKLTANDFIFPPDNNGRGESWKGFIETDKLDPHEVPTISDPKAKKTMRPRAEEYVRKIFEMVKEAGIPLCVVSFPNPDYANDLPYYNYLWAIADEYGIPYIDYNDSYWNIGLDYSADFADWQHLNVRGGIKMSLELGNDLMKFWGEKYGIVDHRGDPAYASYDTCAEIWIEKMYDFVTSPKVGEYDL